MTRGHAPRRFVLHTLLVVGGLAATAFPLAAQSVVQQGEWNAKEILAKETYVKPPAVVERIVTAPRNAVSFTNPAPDRHLFLKTESDGLPTIDAFGKFHYRLGGVEIDPKANRARALTTRGSVGLTLLDPMTGKERTIDTPKGALVNDATWSPDSKSIAYVASFDAATYIFVVDVASGKSVQVTKTPLLATRVTTYRWTADGKSIVAVLLPDNRGPEPKAPAVETGPLVRTSDGRILENRNYASLLRDQHDKDLLDYYTLGQLAVIDVKTHAVKKIGQPALFTAVDASPDAQDFRVTLQTKPYSYLVPVSNFGTVEQLWDSNGKVVAELAKRNLREGTNPADSANGGGFGRGGAASDTGKRNLEWNPAGPGLIYLEADASAPASGGAANGRSGRGGRGGRGAGAAARKDQIVNWLPPYGATDKKVLYEADGRVTAVELSEDGKTLFVDEGNDLYAVRLADPSKRYEIAKGGTIAAGGRGGRGGGFGRGGAVSDSAFYNNPGSLRTKEGPSGGTVAVVGSDGKTVYLEGTKYFQDWTKDAPHNFVDKVDFETGQKTRIFESPADVDATVVDALDDDFSKAIVTRQSPAMVPNSFLLDTKSGKLTQLTHNADFAPEVTHAIRKRLLAVRPRDGYKFYIDVTLPPDYREGTRLPGIIWFYPTEFTTQAEYDQRVRTTNVDAFPTVSPRAPEIWVTQGYVVIQPQDIPIVGPQGRMNDHYVDELREDLDLTLETVEKAGYLDRDRVGLWGHSYGAFSTVNAMVHTPYFKAGIAGDGMYNRTLTPFDFQNERRNFWQAQDTYLQMSPFLYADRLTGALLMYHSLEDQNVGTDPISSIRMMQALQGQGKIAALYMYPYEDHGPATRESDLDQWARWLAWFDIYVKNPQPKQTTANVVP